MRSKKFLSLILAGVMALGICSCDGFFAVKPDGPTETEEETTTEAATETTTAATTTEVVTETTAESTKATSEETTENDNADINAEAPVFVSFKDKTAEEIRENIIKITQVTKDTTLDNYPDRFNVYPNDTTYNEDDDTLIFYHWDPVAMGSTEGLRQAIVQIYRNADGSLGPASRVSITINVTDRERWEEIYTTSCEALKTVLGRDSLMKSGEGDYESSLYMTYFVSKKLENDIFKIQVELPLQELVSEDAA